MAVVPDEADDNCNAAGGGAIACVVASVTASPVWLMCGVAALFCFAVTYARVVSQPIASASVIILVIYFAGVGAVEHTLMRAMGNALDFVLGGHGRRL